MTTTGPVGSLLASARSLAEAGAWAEVVALLTSSGATDGPMDGELVVFHGEALTRTGHEREARDLLRAAVPRLARETERGPYRRAVNLIGVASFTIGDLDEAGRAFEQVRELSTEADDLLLLARASNNLGAIANLQGHRELALSQYRVALPVYQRLGQSRGLAESYHNIAITCRDMGELEEADENERRAIDYAIDARSRRLVAMGRVGRAEIALRRGDAPFAEMAASLAADEFATLADPLMEADARRLVGAALVGRGRATEALASFARALAIAESRGHALNQAEVLRDRVDAWLMERVTDRARDDARRAIELFSTLGATGEVARLTARLEALDVP
ncbi:MAG: hypothetical protein JWN79_2828 [Gemmatimonadetes bacterium]|jgi:tetratricopeptide (TPR) repeat protein|nr:hypothetical protein [Gemmatimonadota bacterium]